MNSNRNKIKLFFANHFVLILIALFGLPYVYYTEGIDHAINIVIVLVGIFSPQYALLIFIYILIGKFSFKEDYLLLLINVILSAAFYIFLMSDKQRLFLFVFDGILSFFWVSFILIQNQLKK